MLPRINPDRLTRLRVLFEDDHLLAVSKPAGIAVHGGAGETKKTVIDIVRAAYDRPADVVLAHRLDRGTSGVLLLTKGQPLAKQVRAKWDEAEKIYWAVALGRLPKPQRIRHPLPDHEGRMQPAATRFTPLAVFDGVEPAATLVEARLETGRTHQIRRHLKTLDHPVLIDDRHGDFAANKAWAKAVRQAGGPRPKHLMLHARRLELPHPVTGEALAFEAAPPPQWNEVLRAAGPEVDVDGLLS